MCFTMDRLYTADFSSIFGAKYANPFNFGQIDSLIWPIFNGIERSKALTNLLELKNHDGISYFYHRKISIEDEKVELLSANIKCGLIQAMDLKRSYGIILSLAQKVKKPISFKIPSNCSWNSVLS